MYLLKMELYFISWALMLTYCAAEMEYFYPPKNLSWDDARRYCQTCYADLATLTPQNIRDITKNIKSDSWIGLRKNLSNSETISNDDYNSTSNHSSSMLWSGWANGDPLSFQNWYPGWPVFRSPSPKKGCCSCPCSGPMTATQKWTTQSPSFTNVTGDTTADVFRSNGFTAENETNFTSPMNVTDTTRPTTPFTALPLEAECVSSPMPTSDVLEIEDYYIEDSCVALLSFGAWIEKHCCEILPFVCFEEPFVGQVNATNVTSSSAVLEWQEGPGNISHYYLEVEHQKPVEALTNLTYELQNLTAGTLHHVKVFPMKCDRKLGPQKTSFYTIPNKVENLKVIGRNETSVALSWDKPEGNVESYIIRWENNQIDSAKTDVEVRGLQPGGLYTFTVQSGVSDGNITSEGAWIDTYTKPGRVLDLKVTDNQNTSLTLTWSKPTGKTSGYLVITEIDGKIEGEENVNQTKYQRTGLPMGTEITFHVSALANDSLEGDAETVSSYTYPGQISKLILTPTHNSINATWSVPNGSQPFFHLKLKLDGRVVTTVDLNDTQVMFTKLKTAAKYTLSVRTVSGQLLSDKVEESTFTLPAPPTNLTITHSNKTTISIKWTPPANTASVTYSVLISSTFWSHRYDEDVKDSMSYTFTGLKSGTNYSIEVKTVAGAESSLPVTTTRFTDPDIREVSLSMLCSSNQTLLCDKEATMKKVFDQLEEHFRTEFQNAIFWELVEPGT